MTPEQTAIWRRMPEDARQRVMAAPTEYRSQLVELWASAQRDDGDAAAQREAVERETAVVHDIQRAVEDSWTDGKRRSQLQRVMQGRLHRLQARGFAGLDDLRRRDRETYDRFLAGCVKAMRRDALIASGMLSQGELRELKAKALGREHDAKWEDAADDWRDAV